MMKINKKLVLALMLLSLVAAPQVLAATNGFIPGNVPTGLSQSTDLTEILIRVTNYVLGFITIIAVLMLIWGGVQYLTAAGDEAAVDGAKHTIMYAVIGLVVVGLSYAIMVVVVNTIIGGVQFVSYITDINYKTSVHPRFYNYFIISIRRLAERNRLDTNSGITKFVYIKPERFLVSNSGLGMIEKAYFTFLISTVFIILFSC